MNKLSQSTYINSDIDFDRLAEIYEGRANIAGITACRGYLRNASYSETQVRGAIRKFQQVQVEKQNAKQKRIQELIEIAKHYQNAYNKLHLQVILQELMEHLDIPPHYRKELLVLLHPQQFLEGDTIQVHELEEAMLQICHDFPQFRSYTQTISLNGTTYRLIPIDQKDPILQTES